MRGIRRLETEGAGYGGAVMDDIVLNRRLWCLGKMRAIKAKALVRTGLFLCGMMIR